MQEDVYQGDGLNLYAYCDNNPVMYYDPSGYCCVANFDGDGVKYNTKFLKLDGKDNLLIE